MEDAEYKQMITTSFDNASEGYDNEAMRFFDKSAEHLIKLLSLKGNERILDVATGTGKNALLLARQLENGHITGIDLSEGMIQQAKDKAEKEDIINVMLLVMDIDDMKFSANYFDGASCCFGIFFLPDMEKGLKNIVNVIKPKGCVAITSFADGSFTPLSDLCLNRFEKYGVKLPDHYTWERLDHQDKHHELFNTAGLENITSETKQMGYYLKDKEQWWDLVYYSGFRSFLNQISEEKQAQFKEEHLAEIEKTAEDKGIWLNVEVIFSIGYKK